MIKKLVCGAGKGQFSLRPTIVQASLCNGTTRSFSRYVELFSLLRLPTLLPIGCPHNDLGMYKYQILKVDITVSKRSFFSRIVGI